jgi:hypothetical protein
VARIAASTAACGRWRQQSANGGTLAALDVPRWQHHFDVRRTAAAMALP